MLDIHSGIRMASMVYGLVAWPLVGLLVAQLSTFLSSLLTIIALSLRKGRQHQADKDKEEDVLPLDLLVSEQGASPSLLLILLIFYSLAGRGVRHNDKPY